MIEVDTALLSEFKLMDYSLLFAIEKIPRAFRKKVMQAGRSTLSDKTGYLENADLISNNLMASESTMNFNSSNMDCKCIY